MEGAGDGGQYSNINIINYKTSNSNNNNNHRQTPNDNNTQIRCKRNNKPIREQQTQNHQRNEERADENELNMAILLRDKGEKDKHQQPFRDEQQKQQVLMISNNNSGHPLMSTFRL